MINPTFKAMLSGPVTALAISLSLASPALAQTTLAQPGQPLGALGRWTLDLTASRFNEALTGAAPLSAELDITKDDGVSLAWTLVEEDADGVAAIQFADAPLDGSTTRAVVNMNRVLISVTREGAKGVMAVTRSETGRKQSMRVWLIDPETLRVEQDVDGIAGPPDQSLTFRRQVPDAPAVAR